MTNGKAASQSILDAQQPEGAGGQIPRRRLPARARRPASDPDHGGGFWRLVISFFVKALELVKPRFMKFLVVLVVAALLAPQVVSHTENPTLALVLVFVCILLFAFFALALELRERQTVFLERELNLLKEEFRQVVQQKRDLNEQNDLLKQELRECVLQRRAASTRSRTAKRLGL
jgi:hypothetical protein